MFTVPAATPVTPPLELTVAMPVALEVQAPPEVPSVSVVVAPAQTVDAPPIAAGAAGTGETVIPAVVKPEPHELLTI